MGPIHTYGRGGLIRIWLGFFYKKAYSTHIRVSKYLAKI
jgi:hypothetical protein